MILLIAIVLAFVIGFARGGRVERLAEIGLRHGWLAIVALVAQMLLVRTKVEWSAGIIGWAMVATYGLLLVFAILNWRIAGIPIAGLGLALNVAVMAANGGLMPIAPETLARAGLAHLASTMEAGERLLGAKDILLPRSEARLWWLGDALVVPLPSPLGAVLSIGDLLLAVGLCVTIIVGLGRRRPVVEV